jgi:hypothetical protein
VLAYQQQPLPLPRPERTRARSVRRPFHPPSGGGPYRLPHSVRDRLASSLAPFRNRDAAMTLAIFIARFWSIPEEKRSSKSSRPGHIPGTFALDRRELVEHPDLGLTERQIRSAISVLEEIGFLDRFLASGSKYKPTEDGLRKKPIIFQFGSEYFPLFDAANKRAAAVRGRDPHARRPIPAETMRPVPAMPSEGSRAKCPKDKALADPRIYLGHVRTGEKSRDRSPISREIGAKGTPPGSLSEGDRRTDRSSQRSSSPKGRFPKMPPIPSQNDERIVNTHLDENEQKVLNTHLDEILAQSIAARRAADAQDGRLEDAGDHSPSDEPIPPTMAPEVSAASSAGIEERERRAAQEKLNALASKPAPSIKLSEAALKRFHKGS